MTLIHYNEFFDTEEEAKAYIAQVYNAYHPYGYGTCLKYVKMPDGRYNVTGSRYSSCD